jgi:glucose-6-phosphate isomerase, archaeal
MHQQPFTFDLNLPSGIPDPYDKHIVRKLSSMRGMYLDEQAYTEMLAKEDGPQYEVYEITRPNSYNEQPCGTSIVHPGKVGDEYFMTKGHFHAAIEACEVYYCLAGEGMMMMENPEGDWQVAELRPGKVLYVTSRWAHRSVNTRLDTDLVTFFVYPGHAGHDYGTIERQGFRKLIVEQNGKPAIVDNPKWQSPHQR